MQEVSAKNCTIQVCNCFSWNVKCGSYNVLDQDKELTFARARTSDKHQFPPQQTLSCPISLKKIDNGQVTIIVRLKVPINVTVIIKNLADTSVSGMLTDTNRLVSDHSIWNSFNRYKATAWKLFQLKHSSYICDCHLYKLLVQVLPFMYLPDCVLFDLLWADHMHISNWQNRQS